MTMLLLHPLPLLQLVVSARDQSSSSSSSSSSPPPPPPPASADAIGQQASSYRSATMLLLLQAALSTLTPPSPSFPPTNPHHKLALITTMRRLWLLECAIGAQAPPPPHVFDSGPDREFEFLAHSLGLSTHARARDDDAHARARDDACCLQLRSAAQALYGSRASGCRGAQLYWPIGLPLQPQLHAPPDCFSDLLVACVAPCACRVVHRAAVLCL